MEHIEFLISAGLIVIGAIVHIEVSVATLKNDVKWIKKALNTKEK